MIIHTLILMTYKPPIRGIRSPIQKKDIIPPQVPPTTRDALLSVLEIQQVIGELRDAKSAFDEQSSALLDGVANIHDEKIDEINAKHSTLHEEFVQNANELLSKVGDLIAQYETKLGEAHDAVVNIKAGKDGKNVDPQEVAAIVLKQIPKLKGKDGKNPSVDEVKRAVLAVLPFMEQKENEAPVIDMSMFDEYLKEHPTIKELHRIASGADSRSRAYLHGGGDTVRAGTNITITANGDGTKTITSSGGSGATMEVPTGAVDSSNTVFTVIHAPLYIIVDGLVRREGKGYSYAAGTITVDPLQPPTFDIFSFY